MSHSEVLCRSGIMPIDFCWVYGTSSLMEFLSGYILTYVTHCKVTMNLGSTVFVWCLFFSLMDAELRQNRAAAV